MPLEEEVLRHAPGGRLAVPSSVLGELDRLVRRNAPGALPARALARRYRVVVAAGRGDTAVLELARRRSAWVVTADQALRSRLVAAGVSVLSPRDRQRLELYRGAPSPLSDRRPSPRTKVATRPRGNG